MTDLAPHSRPVALHVQVRVSADEINKLDPADLVWSTPTDLVAGDRVRVVATGRLGTIGFVNAERALMRLSTDRRHPSFICGRHSGLSGSQCGGIDGSGSPCKACKRFLQGNPELINGLRTPHVCHVTLDAHTGGADESLHQVCQQRATTLNARWPCLDDDLGIGSHAFRSCCFCMSLRKRLPSLACTWRHGTVARSRRAMW